MWVAPQGMSVEHVPQSVASFDFDEKRHALLVSTAPNEREAQRLRRCAQPHANGFITAVPSEEDGRDTLLKPRVFRTAVAYRLGLPLLKEEIPCPLCKQTINIYGDHATWNAGGALAIDVAITSVLGKSALRLENPCEEYAVNIIF